LIKRVLIAALSILTITSGIAAPNQKARRTQKKTEVSRKTTSKSASKRTRSVSKKESRSRTTSNSTSKSKSRRKVEQETPSRRTTIVKLAPKRTSAPTVRNVSRSREIGRGQMKGVNINVRSAPSANANLITKVSGGDVAILAKQGEWYKLRFRYGSEGWVREDFVEVYGSNKVASKGAPIKPSAPAQPKNVKVDAKKEDEMDADPASAPTPDPEPTVASRQVQKSESTFATLVGDSINVRRGPSTSNSVITKVRGGKVELVDKWGDWYKVKFQYGTLGWVRSDFLDIPGVSKPRKVQSETVVASVPDGDKVSGVLRSANGMRGTKYVFGGTSRSATDCSGFTLQVFRANGIKLPRTAREQVHCGVPVKRADLQPGDLIFFNTRGFVSHVGIYIGNGRFIHASSGGRKVQENALTGYYSKRYITARRVIKGGAKLSFPKAGSDLGEIDSTPQAAPGTDIVND
jgi:cell wall-associated NlpC family hydrolase